MSQVWPLVHAERESLVQDLAALTPAQWSTPSLCPGWDVHAVVAHLVDDARTTRLGFVRGLLGARLDFDRYNARGVARERRADPTATLEAFRRAASRTTSAPVPSATRFVEVCVHGEDVRRPLGLAHAYSPVAVEKALRCQLGSSVTMGGGRERAAGLRLVATDLDVDHGSGAEVRGTGLALLLAVSGRPVGADELVGKGAAALR